ncbi:hypothetical protein KY290_011867 [Solanum tuberosum]|uniref:Uncharacterized protein n=1 Tax=Solanum tuberosum TaxID=4113 RepID=A0ABQ7W1X7_SOLTU|nr:hypothetical protein KY284_012633 [Solanum tuberosum]KAH0736193.1 hypothetical protein KY285_011900 [Solanum tuberosum]KAH0774730.1 hypothetical protein KY290_011867 [Solanum tuberosum]
MEEVLSVEGNVVWLEGKWVHLINFLGCGIRSLLGNVVGGQEQIGVIMKIFDSFATFLPK